MTTSTANIWDNLKAYVWEISFPVAALLFLHLFDPFTIAHLYGFALIFYLLIFKRHKLVQMLDREFLWVFFFSFTYTAFEALGPNKGPQFLLIQILFPPIFYLLGKILVVDGMSTKKMVFLLIAIGVIYSSTAVLSVGSSLLKEGFIAAERNVSNFWTGKQTLATNLSSYLIYVLVLPGILLAAKKDINKYFKVFLIGFYIISLLCTFRLGSRTCIAITAISIVIGFFQVLRSQSVLQNIRFLFLSAISIVLVLKFVPFNLNADYFSVLGDRLQEGNASSVATAGNRTGLWQEAMANITEHPLGWDGGGHFAHNTWLDIARVAGIIPLFFFLLNNITLAKNIIKIFNVKEDYLGVTTIFCLYFLATFLLFFGEPLILGNFFAISLFFLLQGVLKKYALSYQKQIMEIKN